MIPGDFAYLEPLFEEIHGADRSAATVSCVENYRGARGSRTFERRLRPRNALASDTNAGRSVGNRTNANPRFAYKQRDPDPGGEYPLGLHRESSNQQCAIGRRGADRGTGPGRRGATDRTTPGVNLSITSAVAHYRGQPIAKFDRARSVGTDACIEKSNLENRLDASGSCSDYSTREGIISNACSTDANCDPYRDAPFGSTHSTDDNRRVSRLYCPAGAARADVTGWLPVHGRTADSSGANANWRLSFANCQSVSTTDDGSLREQKGHAFTG